MTVTFPEVLSDLIDSHERYEADGVQFVAQLEADTVEAGQAVVLLLHAQSVLDQPIQFTVTPNLQRPGVTGRLGGGAVRLQMLFPQTYIELGPGEVGRWRVPMGVPSVAPARQWEVTLNFKGQSDRSERVRPAKSSRPASFLTAFVDDWIGLGIVEVVGGDYESRDGHRLSYKITTTEAPDVVDLPILTPEWDSAWTQNDMTFQAAAQRELNSRRLPIVEELGSPALFETLMESAQGHLEGSRFGPHPGETVALAKILAYTTGLLMHDETTQSALLVPAYIASMRSGHPLGSAIDALCWSGFAHLVRMAIVVSFNAVQKALGRQPWSQAERRGVVQWVSQALEQRLELAPELLYIPLMLGALTVMPVRMGQDENVRESFKMLGFAWQGRQAEFREDPELATLIEAFDTIARGVVNQVMQTAKAG